MSPHVRQAAIDQIRPRATDAHLTVRLRLTQRSFFLYDYLDNLRDHSSHGI